MVATVAKRGGPAHPLAVAALVVSLVASGLALYGSFLSETHLAGSPLNVARGAEGLPATNSKATRYAIQAAAYFLPFVLGVGAALAGGEAMRAIERHAGRYSGNWQAVFAVMVGGLSAVVSGCMILAVFVWKYVPAAYTD
jgi:hypothetical protein